MPEIETKPGEEVESKRPPSTTPAPFDLDELLLGNVNKAEVLAPLADIDFREIFEDRKAIDDFIDQSINARYYSEVFDFDPDTAFRNQDLLISSMFNRTLPPSEATPLIQERYQVSETAEGARFLKRPGPMAKLFRSTPIGELPNSKELERASKAQIAFDAQERGAAKAVWVQMLDRFSLTPDADPTLQYLAWKAIALNRAQFKFQIPEKLQAQWTDETGFIGPDPQAAREIIGAGAVSGLQAGARFGARLLRLGERALIIGRQALAGGGPGSEVAAQRARAAAKAPSPAKALTAEIERWRTDNPTAFAWQRDGSFLENPALAVAGFFESAPSTGLIVGAGIVGGPGAAFGVASLMGGFEIYDRTIAVGGSHEHALLAALIGGPIYGAIEFAKIKGLEKAVGVDKVKQAFASKLTSRLLRRMAVAGVISAREILDNAKEVAEEVGQEFTVILASGEKLTGKELTDRLLQTAKQSIPVLGLTRATMLASRSGLVHAKRRAAQVSEVKRSRRERQVNEIAALVEDGVAPDDAILFVMIRDGDFAPGFIRIPSGQEAEVPGEKEPPKPGEEVEGEAAVVPEEVAPPDKPEALAKLSFREWVDLQDPTADDADTPSVFETAQQDPELMALLRLEFTSQQEGFGEPAKPGAPISEKVDLTEAQRTRLGIEQREKGRKKGEVEGIRRAAREVSGGKVSTVEGLKTFVDKLEIKAVTKAERKAFRAGQIDLEASHKELLAFAKEHLPKGVQDRIIGVIANARTPAEIRRAAESVNRVIQKVDRRLAIDEFKDARKKLNLTKLSTKAQARANELLDAFATTQPFDVDPKTKKGKKRADRILRNLESTIAAAEKEGSLEIPERLIEKTRAALARADKTLLRDMDPADIRGIASTLINIAHVNATKNELKFSRKFHDATKATTLATSEVGNRRPALPGKEQVADEGGDPEQRRKDEAQGKFAKLSTWDQINLEVKARILGGDKGATYNILFEGPKRGQRKAAELSKDRIKALDAAGITVHRNGKKLRTWSEAMNQPIGRWSKLGRKALGFRTVSKAELLPITLPAAVGEKGQRVRTMQATKAEMIDLYAHLTDPSTRAEILKNQAKGIVFKTARGGPAIAIKAADVDAIIKQIPQEVKDVVAAMKAYKNGPLLDELNQAWEEEHGFPLVSRAKDDPFTSEHWSRIREKEFRETDPDKIVQFWYNRQLEHQGIFKPRAGSRAPIVIGDGFESYLYQTNRIISYISKNRAAIDAARLLDDRGFRNMVRSRFKFGEELLGDLQKTIRSYTGMDLRPTDTMTELVNRQIKRAHRGTLGLKPWIVAYQGISYATAATEIDGKYLRQFKHFKLPTKAMRAEISEHSPVLGARIAGGAHGILTPSVGPSLESAFTGKEPGWAEFALAPIHGMDTIVITNLWQAAKAEAKDKGFTGNDLLRETARRTEQIVDRTQPTWDVLTTSSLARDARYNPAARLATLYSSQRNKNLNVAVAAIDEWNVDPNKTPRKTAQMLKNVAIPLVGSSIGVELIRRGFKRRKLNRDDVEEARDIGWAVLKRVLSNWLVAGDIAALGVEIARVRLEEKPGFRKLELEENLIFSAINQTAQAAGGAIDVVVLAKKGRSKKAKEKAIRAGRAAVRAISVLGGVPAAGPLMLGEEIIEKGKKSRGEGLAKPLR